MGIASKTAILAGIVAAATLFAGESYACVGCGAHKITPGKGCGQLVTLYHPDLKGGARKKEWDRCMSGPDKYGK